MAVEYARALQYMSIPFSVKGRGSQSAENFKRLTKVKPFLSWNDLPNSSNFSHCIVAVSEECLMDATMEAVQFGIRTVLVEKPGGSSIETLEEKANQLLESGSRIFVAYNRRFYGIVDQLKDEVQRDGGITSLHFDFSERSRIIEGLPKASGVKENWFLHNSSHVVDLVLYLTQGATLDMTLTRGSMAWHPIGSQFSGVGRTASGGLVTYNSDWESPGGWEVLVRTRVRKFTLKPLEVLSVTDSTGATSTFEETSSNKIPLKPGVLEMVAAFISDKPSPRLLTMEHQIENLDFYRAIIRDFK